MPPKSTFPRRKAMSPESMISTTFPGTARHIGEPQRLKPQSLFSTLRHDWSRALPVLVFTKYCASFPPSLPGLARSHRRLAVLAGACELRSLAIRVLPRHVPSDSDSERLRR